MNNAQVTIVGNVVADPELKFLTNGSAKLGFSVACDRSWKKGDDWETQTSFFNVIAWRDVAENAADVIAKGLRVVVSGRLEQRSWETPEGEKRYAIEVVADDVAVSVKHVEGITRRQRSEGKGQTRRKGDGRESIPGYVDLDKEMAKSMAKPERVVPEEEAW